jgi:hypothetical protein
MQAQQFVAQGNSFFEILPRIRSTLLSMPRPLKSWRPPRNLLKLSQVLSFSVFTHHSQSFFPFRRSFIMTFDMGLVPTTSSVFLNHGTLTSIAYSTTLLTISSCAPTVTDCPARSTTLIPSLLPYSSYICKPTTVTVTTTETVQPAATAAAAATQSPLTQLSYW